MLLICAGVLGGMTCWFSATAILPELIRDWGLTAGQAGWLTNAVQIGFVLGALVSALLNLPDLVQLTRLIALSALLAAAANSVLLIQPGLAGAVAARFVTGFALAGLYPPAMKLMATWFLRGRGLAMGVLLAGLTLGSSMPHLFRALGDGLDWRMVVIASSLATLAAAAIFGALLHEGPHGLAAPGSIRARPLRCCATSRSCGPIWAISAIRGSFTRCGRGFWPLPPLRRVRVSPCLLDPPRCLPLSSSPRAGWAAFWAGCCRIGSGAACPRRD